MMFSLGFHPALRKDLRRIAPDAREALITTIFPSLAKEPTRGIPLTGPLRGFWKYRGFPSAADAEYGISLI